VGASDLSLCLRWFRLARKLESEGGVIDVLLTDKFPNLDTSQRLRNHDSNTAGNIAVNANSVDALHIPETLNGLRTMFSSFHHFPPYEARAILQNAVDAGEGICVFEVSRRDMMTIALMFPWVFVSPA
jgi:hypothetical protein